MTDRPQGDKSPYSEALEWIERHPGTGSAGSLAKLLLSLWNSECAFTFRECVGNLDGNLTALAVRMTAHFAKVGEDEELVRVGYEVYQRYPRLWELGQAATRAMAAQRDVWRREDEAESARLYPDG